MTRTAYDVDDAIILLFKIATAAENITVKHQPSLQCLYTVKPLRSPAYTKVSWGKGDSKASGWLEASLKWF